MMESSQDCGRFKSGSVVNFASNSRILKHKERKESATKMLEISAETQETMPVTHKKNT